MVVGVEVCEEGYIEEVAGGKPSSGSAALKKVADPIVYKLVRVDFDGKLVPATDDELMEVEGFLELEKSEVLSVSDVGDAVGQSLSKDNASEKPSSEKNEGSVQSVDAQVEKKLKVHYEESLRRPLSSLDNRLANQCENTEEELNQPDGFNKSGSSGGNPDFSLLKGKVDLDKLSIRELHETFRATFGRETSAKDKMWLKRRIAMGLTNSCDVSVTSFIIKGGKFLEESERSCKNSGSEDSVAGEVCSSGVDVPLLSNNQMEDALCGLEIRNSFSDSGCKSGDAEQSALKRVRKRTKRYIEELSDKEIKDSGGKVSSPAKCLIPDKTSPRSAVKISRIVHSGAIATRPDSIGGSGVQVPYVSRIRRCRPRKSVMPLTKFQQTDVAVTRKSVQSSVGQSHLQLDDLRGDRVAEIKSVSFEVPITSEEERVKGSLSGMSGSHQCREREGVDSLGNAPHVCVTGKNSIDKDNLSGKKSDDIVTVPSAKGGMRRKHHRAWTLTEVVKLVDGVSKFGAGRWSEIKKHSFASQSYRTSVDLKDKWRNLLKASYASPAPDKGVNARKNAPPPVPAPILVKVRELAEINGQAPKIFRASSENSGSSVNEDSGSGYL